MKVRPYFNLTEYAKLTGLSRETVRKHANAGILKTERLGKRRVITLTYLQSEYPDLWQAFTLAAELRKLKPNEEDDD